MKKTVLTLALLFFGASFCAAETIYLKDGRAVTGEVVEKTAERITLRVRGMDLTYYADEIDRIEDAAPSAATLASPPDVKELPAPALTELPAPAPAVTAAPLESLPLPTPTSSPARRPTSAYAGMDKRELTLKYMEVIGAKGNIRKSFADILHNAPEEKRAAIKRALNLEEVLEELVPIYDQYFSEQDLRRLITFYESPLGQKVLKTAPLILKDSMEKSIKYFEGKME